MKIRTNYVSNSSSSSYLVPCDVSDIVPCIKLSEEIWKAMEKNFIDWDGNKLNLSEISNDWWLTSFINEWDSNHDEIQNVPNKIHYMSGNTEPYDYYDNSQEYTIIKKNYNNFFIANNDLFGVYDDDLPDIIQLRNKIKSILKSSNMNKAQKLEAIKHFVDF